MVVLGGAGAAGACLALASASWLRPPRPPRPLRPRPAVLAPSPLFWLWSPRPPLHSTRSMSVTGEGGWLGTGPFLGALPEPGLQFCDVFGAMLSLLEAFFPPLPGGGIKRR